MDDPVLGARDLRKSFGALVATNDVSLDLRPGEIHALIGPNGAGKSTLIKLISGAMRPDAGAVSFLGRDVSALDHVARARLGLGRSFQISAVIGGFTVRENIVLAAQGAAGRSFGLFSRALGDRAAAALAEEDAQRLGLGARLDIRAEALSHGERRRLELAMALALKPRAFLLDEPMAGLGAEGAGEMTRLLDDLRHDAPILLVEHDMDAVFALADRISVLVSGRVIATGPVAAIRADSQVRRAYLGEEDA